MARKSVSIEVDSGLFQALEKRAKENYMTVREMAEDILRRSMVSYKGGKKAEDKVDDALVGLFSRKGNSKKSRKDKKISSKNKYALEMNDIIPPRI